VVDVLVILDGASEPLGSAPTSLERARTPVLDRLASEGTLARRRTVAPGLPPGSESAIPALLGWVPTAAVDRAVLEAAARGIAIGAGDRAWRIDVLEAGRRAGAAATRAAAGRLAAAAPGHAVHPLAGHRLLLVGPAPLPAAAHRPGLRVWPQGVVPPRILGPETIVVAAPGAAAGAARLLGATVVVPPGATGRPDTDMRAKAAAAVAAVAGGAARVVVHLGAPDEAAHERDAAGKVAAIERADRELVGPLAEALRHRHGSLTVCPDHGCDPATGEHDAAAVPSATWPATGIASPRRLTERAVAGLPVAELDVAHREAA
jgi:2,3-bisphosphoglycerate-independent phosphoglycerate mutase